MASAQPLEPADVKELVQKATVFQLRETPTIHLVQAYNLINNSSIVKFSDRDTALKRTMDAMEKWREEHPEAEEGDVTSDPPTNVGGQDVDFNELSLSEQLEAVAEDAALATALGSSVQGDGGTTMQESEKPFRIKLPYTGKTRAPKKNSKRAKLLELMLGGQGVLIDELSGTLDGKEFNWPRKDAYEGIRHIHVSLGYGLDQYPDGRIYAHTDEPGKHFDHQQKMPAADTED